MQPPMQAFAERLQTMTFLDPLADRLSDAFNRVVKPGPLKDALSGTYFGHPMHPPLTTMAIGSWMSAATLDAVGGEAARPASDALVGVGVMAAMPTLLTGWNELADTTGSERRVAVVHGIGNVLVTGLFAASYLARRRGNRGLGRALAATGAGLVSMTAFLGGHLTFIKGVGVNETAFEAPKHRWTPVLPAEQLPEGRSVRANADGIDLLLYRSGATVFALSNRCTHRGGPLNRGPVRPGGGDAAPIVTCPWHGSQFRMDDGGIVRGPATAPQPAYEARINADQVEVRPRSG